MFILIVLFSGTLCYNAYSSSDLGRIFAGFVN